MKQFYGNIFPLLSDAVDFVEKNKGDGCICPCCKQFARVYNRKLTSSMAVGLISLYRQQNGKPIHIKNIANVNGGEFAQLIRWKLIIDLENNDEKKRTSGMWQITDDGVEFVKGIKSVPKYCATFNGETLGFSEELTNIVQALSNKFNYAELMGEVILK